MARQFKKELQGKPINFLRDVKEVNLRSSPAVADKNLVASVPRWFVSLGKLGEATGTIETVPGKNHFWIRIDLSTEVKAWFAVTFKFNAPGQAWVRSDVVHWKGAKGVVRRATEKAVEPVKEVLDVTAEAAGDVFGTVFKELGGYLIAGAAIYIIAKQTGNKRTTKTA